MGTIFHRHMMSGATFLSLLVLAYAGNANAQAPHPCPDDANWKPPFSPAGCTKEIRVWNNTGHTIWVVVQASIQQQAALGDCPVKPNGGGGGDAWLQRALNDPNNCHAVNNDYYAYVNPSDGFEDGEFVSLNVPWWSRTEGGPDKYVDWWRAGRVHIFDDKVALNDSYNAAQETPQVRFETPAITCKDNDNPKEACDELKIYRVAAGSPAQITVQSPHQLNEYTFADVGDPAHKFELFSLNQNYNVSNVDQVYLPLAMEPIREPPLEPDIGYMGTTITVKEARDRMMAFTGAAIDPTNPPNWPIYNNPMVNGQPRYPEAGIRVPSTYDLLIYYMQPYFFRPPLPPNTPVIIPAKPPALVQGFIDQWQNCTTTGKNCPQPDHAWYQQVDNVFLDNYKSYIQGCTTPNCVPPYLTPGAGPVLKPENMFAYLAYIYGWVPFNNNFVNKPLPTPDLPPDQNGNAPIHYISMQYNFETLLKEQWFNPYTQFIHGDAAHGGLGANAYAFSIDDSASVQNNAGGGLIFAVGGDNGLPNKTQVPPPVPAYHPYYDFVVGLGEPAIGGARWAKYGVCSSEATTVFPSTERIGYSIGVNPELYTFPCTLTLTDTQNRKYQINIKQAAVPPAPIWPAFDIPGKFDPNVVSCPTVGVPPAQWCDFINERAIQKPDFQAAPFYNLSAPQPLP